MRRIIVSFILIVIAAGELFAWGPLTHLLVNEEAYYRASKELGRALAIPDDLKSYFIGGGPAPDINQTSGEKFSKAFHYDIDTVLRMIELAKTDERFGLIDVAEALGWAGHLFSEVPSAHTSEGYPNVKVTVTVQNAGGINHQLSELALDILSYRERRASLSGLSVSMPFRLLETSMKLENERDPSKPCLPASEIKKGANAFLSTVVGIRAIAEYLVHQRPELLDEMDAFYSDRHEHIERSVVDVTDLLRNHGCRDFVKKNAGSADKTEKVSLALDGNLKQIIKSVALQMISVAVRSEKTSDLLTKVGYIGMHCALGNGLLQDNFMKVLKSFGSGNLAGNDRNKQIVVRFTEALLTRFDLTFPEIVAYAQEGIDEDESAIVKRKQQFASVNLTESGRRKVTLEEVRTAVDELNRVESVRKEWPWFWPWRPSSAKLAESREKSGRMIAYYILDNGFSQSLQNRASALLESNRALRSQLLKCRNATWINPFDKLKQGKTLESMSDSFCNEQKYLGNIIQVIQVLKTTGSNLAQLRNQTSQRLVELENSLKNLREYHDQIPIWNILKRSQARDEIRRLEENIANLTEYISVIESIDESAEVNPPLSSSSQAPEYSTDEIGDDELSKWTLASVQAELEKVYKQYAAIAERSDTQNSHVRELIAQMARLKNIRRLLEEKRSSKRN